MHRTQKTPKNVNQSWVPKLLTTSRVAHLATCTSDRTPHVVPICYVFDGKMIYTPIDEKPKRSAPGYLRRVLNISQNPRISFVVHSYSEDWRNLRYVIVNGFAVIMHSGREHKHAVSLLRKKYHQYLAMKIDKRPIIRIRPLKFLKWMSSLRTARGEVVRAYE